MGSRRDHWLLIPPTHCGSQRPPPWVTRVSCAYNAILPRDAGFCRPAIFLGYGVRFSATGVSSSIVGQTGTDGELRRLPPSPDILRCQGKSVAHWDKIPGHSSSHAIVSLGQTADDRVLLTWWNQDEVASPCARGRAVVRRMSAARASNDNPVRALAANDPVLARLIDRLDLVRFSRKENLISSKRSCARSSFNNCMAKPPRQSTRALSRLCPSRAPNLCTHYPMNSLGVQVSRRTVVGSTRPGREDSEELSTNHGRR